jgi:hypothetical protein
VEKLKRSDPRNLSVFSLINRPIEEDHPPSEDALLLRIAKGLEMVPLKVREEEEGKFFQRRTKEFRQARAEGVGEDPGQKPSTLYDQWIQHRQSEKKADDTESELRTMDSSSKLK